MITKTNLEYLKTIYKLEKKQGKVRVTDIANTMGITKASVNKAIKTLAKDELLNYETYGKIELTQKGKANAQKMLEAYDIIYLFFKEILDLDEILAQQEAEQIKQDLDDETLNKLAKYTYKELGLNLDCNYNINSLRCRNCKRKEIKI